MRINGPAGLFDENSEFQQESAGSRVDQTAVIPLTALNNLTRPVAVVGAEYRMLYKNRAFDALFGSEMLAQLRNCLDTVAQGIDRAGSREYAFDDGRTFRIETLGLPQGLLITAEDISERVAELARSAELARTDPLTLLGNRVMFRERLREVIGDLDPAKETAAVLSIDLDRFKAINDSLGHSVGDALLRGVAGRLS
jgi:predicted signal transduction protein with EAL and GGDEF domain